METKFLVPKVVIDTNIYISALFWGGKPRKIIDLGREKNILIFTSADIEREIAKKLKIKFKLDEKEVNKILLDFSTFTIPVKVTQQMNLIFDDPDDDKFLECAVSGKANYIVSGDNHLLKLKEYAGIKILKSSQFLASLHKE